MGSPRKVLLAAATSAVLASVAFAVPAQAAQGTTSAVSAKATVACKLTDPKAATSATLADAAATKELCQKWGIPGSGPYAPGFTPASTVYGNCGSSFIYLYDRQNGGNPDFNYGVNSTLGPIITGSVAIWWQNLRTNGANHFDRTVYPNAGPNSFSEHYYDEWTGTGAVYTTMTGSVEVGSGTVCTLAVPTDTESIN